MPNWKKVVTSGSNAELNQITASGFNLVGSGTAELEVDGHITASGNISASGKIITEEVESLSDFTLNVEGDVTIDANGADIILSDNGTDFGRFKRDSSDFIIKSEANNNDIEFRGQDGGATITALTLDMSEAGSATFNNHITASGNISSSGTITALVSMSAAAFSGDGSGLTNVSATVADESITLAKLAHADANTVLVRDANSAGDPSFKEVTNQQILIGDGTGFTAAALSGDVTMTNAGVVSLADNISLTNLTASGNISGSSTSTINVGGDITASSILLDGDLVIPHTGHLYLNGIGGGEYIEANGSSQIDIRVNNSQAAVFRQAKVGIPGYHAGDETLNVEGVASASSFVSNTHITASGDISASGTISANATTETGLDKLVTYDTSTGQFHITASSTFLGSGGGGGSTDAAGSDTQVQFNDGGTNFGGDAGFTYNKTTDSITVAGHITASGKILSKDEIILDDNGGDTLVRMYASNDDGIIDIYQNNNALTRIAGNGTSFFKDNEGVLIGPGENIATSLVGGETTALTIEGHISSSGDSYFGKSSTDIHTFAGHITASGDISASITSTGSFGNVQINGEGRGQLEVDYRLFETGSSHLQSAGGAIGDIVKFGGTSTTAGNIYFLKPDGNWGDAQANAVGTSTGSLAVALGTNSTTDGMLLKGMVKLAHDPSATIGNPVFLDDTAANRGRNDAPDTSNDVVRIIGHYYSGSGTIYFNPDNTFIEVA